MSDRVIKLSGEVMGDMLSVYINQKPEKDEICPLIMILISKLMINRKRELPPAATAGAIAPFAALGTVFAKIDRSNSSNNFHILLAFLACIFLVFHIYFIKYYYAKKLEKISEVIEDESN